MPTPKRAWLYVVRNKKRTTLLFLLLVVLMAISQLGLALHAASGEAVKNLRSSIGGYITIQTAMDSPENTDDALLQQVRTLDNVSKYNGVDPYYMYTEGLELIPGSYRGTGMVGEFVPKFVACTDSSLHERFVGASFLLAEGRHIAEDDLHKAMVSQELAQRNGLSLGDTIHASVVEGVAGWQPEQYGTEVGFEIVSIYQIARNEPSDPTTPESELQENMIFTDISTAKELYALKFPDRPAESFVYSLGIFLFLDDPALMEQTATDLQAQPYADWDNYVISQNDTRYQSAAAPIQKAETLSLVLLLVILVLSIGILALILLMWTRERMTEVGILISLGISQKAITRQIILENYIIGLPAFAVSLLVSLALSGTIGKLIGGMLQDIQLASYISPMHAAFVLIGAAIVIFIAVLLASISIMQKKPKDILTDLSS